MPKLVITKDFESLQEATRLITKLFNQHSQVPEQSQEWEKWAKWFNQQKNKFNAEELSVDKYFTQIKHVHSFLEKIGIPSDELFEMMVSKRKKQYDFTRFTIQRPEKLSEANLGMLIRVLYTQLTLQPSTVKPKPLVDSLIRKRRERRYGRQLLADPQLELARIEIGEILSMPSDQQNLQRGELYCELKDYSRAKTAFELLSMPLRAAALAWLATLQRDFSSFQQHVLKAFPESYDTFQTSGIYLLSFLIGNESSFRYERDSLGNRCVSFVFSTGIVKITKLDLLEAFLNDLRLSPDGGRCGIWLRPGLPAEQFIHENATRLLFKQVLGWQNL